LRRSNRDLFVYFFHFSKSESRRNRKSNKTPANFSSSSPSSYVGEVDIFFICLGKEKKTYPFREERKNVLKVFFFFFKNLKINREKKN
jgi:hypothetical protein